MASSNITDLPFFSDNFQEILLPSTLNGSPGKRNEVDDDGVLIK